MLHYKLFDIGFDTAVKRFYLMIAGVAALGFLHMIYLGAVWGMVMAGSFILGIKIIPDSKKSTEKREGKVIPVDTARPKKKRA